MAKSIYSKLSKWSKGCSTRFYRMADRKVNAALYQNNIAATFRIECSEDRPQFLLTKDPGLVADEACICSVIKDALLTIGSPEAANLEAMAPSMIPLAEIVDALARKLRQEGAPPERWATFVHVGI